MTTEILEFLGLAESVSSFVVIVCVKCLLFDSSPAVREFQARFEQAWHRFDFSSCESTQSLGSLSATFSNAGKVRIDETGRFVPMADRYIRLCSPDNPTVKT
jgi:hypothetical protein